MEFKIFDVLRYYFENILLALTAFIITFLIGYIYIDRVYVEKYVGETTIMLGAYEYVSGESSNLNIGLNQSVVENYIELIKSNKVLERVIERDEFDYSVAEVRNMLNVYYKDDTEYIVIEVTSLEKEECGKLSYYVYETLVEEVERIFGINNIYLIDTCEVGSLKHDRTFFIKLNILIAAILSFLATTIKFLFFINYDMISALFGKSGSVKRLSSGDSKNKRIFK